jgi:hypothetical protein
MNFIDKFITYLTPGHFEGIVLFLWSCAAMTGVNIYYSKEWTTGLKGTNKLWEAPEILIYIVVWMMPVIIFAAVFMQLPVPDMVWYTLLLIVVFALVGKWGFEWLLAFKSGASSVTSTAHTTEKTVEKEKIVKEQ